MQSYVFSCCWVWNVIFQNRKRRHSRFIFIMKKNVRFWTQNIEQSPNSEDPLQRKRVAERSLTKQQRKVKGKGVDDLKKVPNLTDKILFTLQYLLCPYPEGFFLHLVENIWIGLLWIYPTQTLLVIQSLRFLLFLVPCHNIFFSVLFS